MKREEIENIALTVRKDCGPEMDEPLKNLLVNDAAQRQVIEQLREALEGLLKAWNMDRGSNDKEKMTAWMEAMSKALQQAQAALAATGEERKAQP